MPTYEYRCPAGHEFEQFQKMSESQPTLPCPVCGEAAERRVSGGAGLVFKGSGFYITDYGKDGKKDQKKPAASSEGASSSAGADGGAKTEAKSEPKPEPKAETKSDAKPAASAAPPKSTE
jgi:putative FmdB family regulatory protein